MSKAPLLLAVTWLDASVVTQGDWLTLHEIIEEIKKPERSINITIGWLLWEDKTAIVLAAQKSDQEDPLYDLCIYIPKSLIRKRRVLKV